MYSNRKSLNLAAKVAIIFIFLSLSAATTMVGAARTLHQPEFPTKETPKNPGPNPCTHINVPVTDPGHCSNP